jgi:hypothetical protein
VQGADGERKQKNLRKETKLQQRTESKVMRGKRESVDDEGKRT